MVRNIKKIITKSKNKRPSLFEENNSLKETIKALQDQNANLAASNHEFDKQNSILEERLSSFGLRDLCKSAGWAGIGLAGGIGFTGQPMVGMVVAMISSILIMIFSIYDNFWAKKKEKNKVEV